MICQYLSLSSILFVYDEATNVEYDNFMAGYNAPGVFQDGDCDDVEVGQERSV